MSSKQIQLIQITPDSLAEQILKGVDEKLKDFAKGFETPKEVELMTVDETLQFLKCSKQALWNWRKSGILPSYRLGNRVYYKKSDVFNNLVKQS